MHQAFGKEKWSGLGDEKEGGRRGETGLAALLCGDWTGLHALVRQRQQAARLANVQPSSPRFIQPVSYSARLRQITHRIVSALINNHRRRCDRDR